MQVGRRRRSIGSQRALGRSRRSPEAIDAIVVGARRPRHAPDACGGTASAAPSCCGCASTTSHARPDRTRSRGRPPRPQTILATARGLLADAMPLIERQGLTLVGVSIGNLEDDDAVQLDAAVRPVQRRRARRRARRGPRPIRVGRRDPSRAARHGITGLRCRCYPTETTAPARGALRIAQTVSASCTSTGSAGSGARCGAATPCSIAPERNPRCTESTRFIFLADDETERGDLLDGLVGRSGAQKPSTYNAAAQRRWAGTRHARDARAWEGVQRPVRPDVVELARRAPPPTGRTADRAVIVLYPPVLGRRPATGRQQVRVGIDVDQPAEALVRDRAVVALEGVLYDDLQFASTTHSRDRPR